MKKHKLTSERAACMAHARRIKELRGLGYPDDHPLIAMHERYIAELKSREAESRGGSGTGATNGSEDKEPIEQSVP